MVVWLNSNSNVTDVWRVRFRVSEEVRASVEDIQLLTP